MVILRETRIFNISSQKSDPPSSRIKPSKMCNVTFYAKIYNCLQFYDNSSVKVEQDEGRSIVENNNEKFHEKKNFLFVSIFNVVTCLKQGKPRTLGTFSELFVPSFFPHSTSSTSARAQRSEKFDRKILWCHSCFVLHSKKRICIFSCLLIFSVLDLVSSSWILRFLSYSLYNSKNNKSSPKLWHSSLVKFKTFWNIFVHY